MALGILLSLSLLPLIFFILLKNIYNVFTNRLLQNSEFEAAYDSYYIKVSTTNSETPWAFAISSAGMIVSLLRLLTFNSL